MSEEVIDSTTKAMQHAVESLEREFKRLRRGRATPSLVEHLFVEYYGTPTPITQVASISAPEPRMLVIKPFDAGAIVDIEKAIVKSDLGLNPQSDGKLIRLNIPPLNEETRKKLMNDTKKILENAKVSVRSARRDGNKDLDTLCKDKAISEDQRDAFKTRVQNMTKEFEDKLDALQKAKEKELKEV